jgi:hypothetical protein
MNYNEKRKKIVLQFIFTEEPYKRGKNIYVKSKRTDELGKRNNR